MQKYIMRRALKRMERKNINAEDWDEATRQLKEFIDKPIPDDCVLIDSSCNIEYIGDV